MIETATPQAHQPAQAPRAVTLTRESAARVTLRALRLLLGSVIPRDFAVRLWDGTTWSADPGQKTRFTIVLRHPGALRAMALPPSQLALGEAFLRGDFSVEGDLIAATALGDRLLTPQLSLAQWYTLARLLLTLPTRMASGPLSPRGAGHLRGNRHSRHRDRAAVTSHYDVGNDFYALWLDRRMVYSCAYFPTGAEDLDSAQEAKLDLICRKLRLQPGERLLDIGCGWGGLILHAAQHYGVHAMGITLSEPQAALARQRIAWALASAVKWRCVTTATSPPRAHSTKSPA